MADRRDEERRFLDDIDRLLAGEGVVEPDEASDDYRTAIEFSRMLADLNEGPSDEFRLRLRRRLLAKLAERDAAAREKDRTGGFLGFLGRLVPGSPVWRTATVTVAVLIVTITVAWRAGMFTGSAPGAAPAEDATMQTLRGAIEEAEMLAPKAADGVGADAAAQPSEAESAEASPVLMRVVPAVDTILAPYGEAVAIDVEIAANRDQTLTVRPLPPELSIVADEGGRTVRTIAAGDTEAEIAPGSSVHEVIIWDQLDDAGKQVAPGWYGIRSSPVEVSGDFGITYQDLPPLPRVLVQYPQGTMEKLIEPNLTATDAGLDLTLERIVLHAQGVVFSVFTGETEGIVDEDGQTGIINVMPAPARYAADGVVIQATQARIDATENGVRLTWDQQHFMPVPADATELVIVVSGLGQRQGRWEFRVPL